MLQLIGRKGDGWLPSLPYIKDPSIGQANAIIDDAAMESGRNPSDIRRLINLMGDAISDPDTVSKIAALATENGFSTFIFASDDPDKIAMLGQSLAPRVRDEVARIRASRSADIGAVRSASTLPLRRRDIDYDALPAQLTDKVVEPGDADYRLVRSTYFHRGAPGMVIRAENADDVIASVRFARAQNVPLSVRSGGHGISGRSTNDGGIVIDVGRINQIDLIDPATNRVRLGPGARWGDVAAKLAEFGLGLSSGDSGDVGVGGLATAGGIGWLSRKHGLTIDHMVAAEIVVADGRLLRVDAEHEPELFWGIRGAGGNFGVVTALEFEAYPVGQVVHASFIYDFGDAKAIARWADAVTNASRDLTGSLIMAPARSGSPPVGHAMIVVDTENVDAAEAILRPFLDVAPVLGSEARLMPYPALLAPSRHQHDGQGGLVVHGGLITELTESMAEAVGTILSARAAGIMQLRSLGGAVNDVDTQATAFAHRSHTFSLVAMTSPAQDARLQKMVDELGPNLDGLYINFETGVGWRYLEAAFPGPTLQRLQQLKARFDPEERFNANFNIPPARSKRAAEGFSVRQGDNAF